MTLAALLAVLLSALLHASWNATTKGSGSPIAFLFWMIALACLALAPGLLFVDLGDIEPATWRLILASGAIHGLYALFLSRAYERGDLTLVYPISRSTPALVPLVAVPLLGESLSLLGAAGIALVVASLWLIQTGTPGFAWRRLLEPGNAYAFLTLLVTVAYSLTDAAVMRRLDAGEWQGAMPRALFFFLVQGAIQLALFWMLIHSSLPPLRLFRELKGSLKRLLFAVATSVLSYWLILEAMRSAEVSYIVAVRQSSVLFALLIGVVYLRERPSRRRVLGTVGTGAGVALIAFA